MLAKLVIVCASLSCITIEAAAQTAVDLDTLNARCEAARQARLVPIRQQKIAQCEASADKPQAGCQVF